jgi:hypothetical protein
MVNALVFIDFGAAFLLFPAQLAALLDIELTSATALADLRAIYGGLALSVGALFALGLRRASWLAPCLFLVAASSAALALSRIYSIAVSGMPRPIILVFLVTEVASSAWALLAYRALERPARRSLPGAAQGALG